MGTNRCKSTTTGYATSVIAASAEAAIERTVPAAKHQTNDLGILIQIYNQRPF